MSCHETVSSCASYKGSEEAIAFYMNIHFRGTCVAIGQFSDLRHEALFIEATDTWLASTSSRQG